MNSLYEEWFHCEDLGSQLGPIIKRLETFTSTGTSLYLTISDYKAHMMFYKIGDVTHNDSGIFRFFASEQCKTGKPVPGETRDKCLW